MGAERAFVERCQLNPVQRRLDFSSQYFFRQRGRLPGFELAIWLDQRDDPDWARGFTVGIRRTAGTQPSLVLFTSAAAGCFGAVLFSLCPDCIADISCKHLKK